MIYSHWQVAEAISPDIINQFPEIEPVLLQLLWNRGLRTQDAIDEFLQPDWSQDIHNPYLFRHMSKAVEIIYEAIGKGETIGVFGDYDADGVCAAVILISTLKKLGAQTEIYLPHREREGYGLNEEAIGYFKERGVNLMITCDCGIANVKQIDYANSLGFKVIVTDHHQAQDKLPAAAAILHPSLEGETYPFKFLSGGGVAFKLVQGLLNYEGCQLTPLEKEAHEKWLTDLVAISTVADMVRLIGENRTLVKYGLRVLQKTRRVGLRKLVELAGLSLTTLDSYAIAWQIAPRLNAAGRMDHANSAYALLITENDKEAEELARAINLANSERQTLTEQMLGEAKEQIGTPSPDTFIVHAFKPDWGLGLAGLVAGKLVQEYNLPALVMCRWGDKIAGSARAGVGEFNLAKALQECGNLLLTHGGHKEAAGFSLSPHQLEVFIEKINQIAKRELQGKDLSPSLVIDAPLVLEQIDWKLADEVNLIEPVGQGNPRPRFVSYNLTVTEAQAVGSLGQHLRLELEQNNLRQRFIWFRTSQDGWTLRVGDRIDVVYEVGINEWNNERQLQLKIVAMRRALN